LAENYLPDEIGTIASTLLPLCHTSSARRLSSTRFVGHPVSIIGITIILVDGLPATNQPAPIPSGAQEETRAV